MNLLHKVKAIFLFISYGMSIIFIEFVLGIGLSSNKLWKFFKKKMR